MLTGGWPNGSSKADVRRCPGDRGDLEDNLNAARAINGLANIRSDQGDLDGARQLFEKALELGRKIGDQRDVSGALNNIGFMLSSQGKLTEAGSVTKRP